MADESPREESAPAASAEASENVMPPPKEVPKVSGKTNNVYFFPQSMFDILKHREVIPS